MKTLVEKLGDGKKYKFSTFSVTEATGLKKYYRKFEDQEEEARKIRYVTDDKGKLIKENGIWVPKENLTSEEKDKLEAMEDEQLAFTADVVRKSLCRHHPEFKKVEDKEKDAAILESITDIIDFLDMKNITHFAFKGVYIREKEVIEFDLDSELEDDEK